MIILDTETTGLIQNEALPLDMQPRILEIGAIKVDSSTLEPIEEYSALLLPAGYELTDEIKAITGLTMEELRARGKQFPLVVPRLAQLFLGEDTLLAHNLRFDLMMLVFELRRIDWQYRFPFPRCHIDTTTSYPGRLSDWAKETGYPLEQAHRALDDCHMLLHCYRHFIAKQEGAWTR